MQHVNEKAIHKMETKKRTREEMKSATAFFGDVKQELRRIEWTSKNELLFLTKVALACIFIFGLSVYFVDLLVRGGLEFMNLLVKWLVG